MGPTPFGLDQRGPSRGVSDEVRSEGFSPSPSPQSPPIKGGEKTEETSSFLLPLDGGGLEVGVAQTASFDTVPPYVRHLLRMLDSPAV